MALKGSAKWVRGISRVRFLPLNDDKTIPSKTNLIGGTGPFDFSAADVTIAAVPLTVKIDNGAAETKNLVLTSYTAHKSAILASEIVTAITTAAFTGITATVDSNGRVKLVSASGTVVQVYGQAALLCRFGQGLGLMYLKSNTIETVTIEPVIKADTTYTTTPADGIDVEVIDEGYKKGVTGTVVDTAIDYSMMQLFEGGSIDSAGIYTDPSENSRKVYFLIEIYNPVYAQGSQKVGELTAYEKTLVKSAVGAVGGDSFAADFRKKSYTFTATNFKVAGVSEGAVSRAPVTIAAYGTLDIDNV